MTMVASVVAARCPSLKMPWARVNELRPTRTTPVPFMKLIVVEQSRLGRDQIDTMVLIRDIEEAGIEIWSTRDSRRITLSDDTSKLLASLEGWRDESERKKTATRVRDAAKTRFERGTWSAAASMATRTSACPA